MYIEASKMATTEWDDAAEIISSNHRATVLERLAGGPATPSQIAADTAIGITHVSRALGRLRERSLVELLVSEDRQKGRVYGITDHGSEIREWIDEADLDE